MYVPCIVLRINPRVNKHHAFVLHRAKSSVHDEHNGKLVQLTQLSYGRINQINLLLGDTQTTCLATNVNGWFT